MENGKVKKGSQKAQKMLNLDLNIKDFGNNIKTK